MNGDKNMGKLFSLVGGILFSIIIPVLFFLGSNVIANDRKNTTEFKEVRKEMAIVQEKIREDIEEIKETQTDIKLSVKEIQIEQRIFISQMKDFIKEIRNQ